MKRVNGTVFDTRVALEGTRRGLRPSNARSLFEEGNSGRIALRIEGKSRCKTTESLSLEIP